MAADPAHEVRADATREDEAVCGGAASASGWRRKGDVEAEPYGALRVLDPSRSGDSSPMPVVQPLARPPVLLVERLAIR